MTLPAGENLKPVPLSGHDVVRLMQLEELERLVGQDAPITPVAAAIADIRVQKRLECDRQICAGEIEKPDEGIDKKARVARFLLDREANGEES